MPLADRLNERLPDKKVSAANNSGLLVTLKLRWVRGGEWKKKELEHQLPTPNAVWGWSVRLRHILLATLGPAAQKRGVLPVKYASTYPTHSA